MRRCATANRYAIRASSAVSNLPHAASCTLHIARCHAPRAAHCTLSDMCCTLHAACAACCPMRAACRPMLRRADRPTCTTSPVRSHRIFAAHLGQRRPLQLLSASTDRAVTAILPLRRVSPSVELAICAHTLRRRRRRARQPRPHLHSKATKGTGGSHSNPGPREARREPAARRGAAHRREEVGAGHLRLELRRLGEEQQQVAPCQLARLQPCSRCSACCATLAAIPTASGSAFCVLVRLRSEPQRSTSSTRPEWLQRASRPEA